MVVYDSFIFYFLFSNQILPAAACSTTHREVTAIRPTQDSPEIFLVFIITKTNALGRAASQWMHHLTAITHFNAAVTAEYFSPSFFQNEDPDLIALARSAEGPLSFCIVVGKVVIDDDHFFFAVDVQLHSVYACLVSLLS